MVFRLVSTKMSSMKLRILPSIQVIACSYSQIAEAQNADAELFGIDRVVSHLKASGDSSLEDTIAGLCTTVAEWEGEEGQEDDMSIVLIEFLGRTAKTPGTEVDLAQLYSLERRQKDRDSSQLSSVLNKSTKKC